MSKEYFTDNISDETLAKLIDETLSLEKTQKDRSIKRSLLKIVPAVAVIAFVIGLVNILPMLNGVQPPIPGNMPDEPVISAVATEPTPAPTSDTTETPATTERVLSSNEKIPHIGEIVSIDIEAINGSYIIEQSDNGTIVGFSGSGEFYDILKMDYVEETGELKISYDKEKADKIDWDKMDVSINNITIQIEPDKHKLAELKMKAMGDCVVDIYIPFEKTDIKTNGSITVNVHSTLMDEVIIRSNGPADVNLNDVQDLHININGTGDINFNNAQLCNININGSGNVKFNNSDNATLSINGDGNIDFNEAKSCNASINGSGDVVGGKVNTLIATINGSGNMGFVECDDFTAEIDGAGKITVDKVNKSVYATIQKKYGDPDGRGNIIIKSGEIETFYAYIESTNNKALIDAKNVTADTANITIKNRGTVEIGKVNGELVSDHGDESKLIMHEK